MVCVAAALAGACAISQERDPCRGNICGGDHIPLGIHVWSPPCSGGAAGPKAARITSVQDRRGASMKLRLVDGDRLLGVDPAGGGVIAEHGGLIGARIGVSVDGVSHELVIRGAAPSERFRLGAQLPIEAYEFASRPLDGGPEAPLCSAGVGDPIAVPAIVFGGDLYDLATGAITVGPATNGWLNVACAGSAIYAMHELGYTSAAQSRLGIATTLEQRRAKLAEWASDACDEPPVVHPPEAP